MAETTKPIATWYECTLKQNVNEGSGEQKTLTSDNFNYTPIGTGTTLNFAGVEAGEPSAIKCIRIKFSRRVAKLRFWLVNNISGTSGSTDNGVFGAGWAHGYHVRGGSANSPLLDPNNPSAFESAYSEEPKGENVINPYGSIVNGASNKNKFVYIPRDTAFFTSNASYYQWGEFGEDNGNFGTSDPNASEDDESWWTPFIYLVVTPPMSADGGARTGWGYRISFLYS